MQLEINGEKYTVDAPGDMPLLWVLRDLLQLTGTKYGCGIAQCGACTVHLDGVATRSCTFPVKAVGLKKIVTIEGLSNNGSHPLQKAWQEEDVPQCGYCQAGQIMTAASLLTKNPHPSDEQIIAGMRGNICRCGTYNRIHKAIRKVADETKKQ